MRIEPNDVRIKRELEEGNKGTFVIEPLPKGYGNTVGNSLRRVLLSSLPGAAVTQVKFSGVQHQFTTIKGVKEDVVELCLNLKQLRVKLHSENPVVLKLSKNGPGLVRASDFEVPSDAKIVNEDLQIATLSDKTSKIELEAVVEAGVGYVPSEERETSKIGVILLDSVFSPVSVVSYRVDQTRVGRETDLDKLVINIETDGSIKPFDALLKASEIVASFFQRLSTGTPETEEDKSASEAESTVKNGGMGKEEVLIEELPLPTRTINALKKAGIKTFSDLSALGGDDLSQIKNLGDKSIEEIKKLLEDEGAV